MTAGAAVVSVEVVALTVRSGRLHALLSERGGGCWGLPGVAKVPSESLLAGAIRALEDAPVGPLHRAHVEQLGSYGDPGRDPSAHTVSVAHLALVPDARLGAERPDLRFWAVDDLADGYGPPLVLDHDRILADAVERTRAKLEYTTLASHLVDDPFAVGDLYDVYRAVWGIDPGDRANFARKVTRTPGFVVPVDASARPSGRGRPSRLYTSGPATRLHPPITRAASVGLE